MSREHANRIPEKEAQSFSSWKIPTIGGKEKILSSAEKEDRERKEKEKKQKGEVVGETIDASHVNGPITAAELERITQEAHAEGYQAGFEQGTKEGIERGTIEGREQAYNEYKEKFEDQINRLSLLVSGLSDPFEQETQALQNIVLNTVMSLAASIVKKEFVSDSKEISQLIEQALEALPKSSKKIAINLHPKDIALLEEYCPEKVKHWTLIPSTNIHVGGAFIESQDSTVDCTLEQQLKTLGERFLNGEFIQLKQEQKQEVETGQEKNQTLNEVSAPDQIVSNAEAENTDNAENKNNKSNQDEGDTFV